MSKDENLIIEVLEEVDKLYTENVFSLENDYEICSAHVAMLSSLLKVEAPESFDARVYVAIIEFTSRVVHNALFKDNNNQKGK